MYEYVYICLYIFFYSIVLWLGWSNAHIQQHVFCSTFYKFLRAYGHFLVYFYCCINVNILLWWWICLYFIVISFLFLRSFCFYFIFFFFLFSFLFTQHFVDRVSKIRATWYKNHEISFVVFLSFIVIVFVFESFLCDSNNCFFLKRISSVSYISNTIPAKKSKKMVFVRDGKLNFLCK